MLFSQVVWDLQDWLSKDLPVAKNILSKSSRQNDELSTHQFSSIFTSFDLKLYFVL